MCDDIPESINIIQTTDLYPLHAFADMQTNSPTYSGNMAPIIRSFKPLCVEFPTDITFSTFFTDGDKTLKSMPRCKTCIKHIKELQLTNLYWDKHYWQGAKTAWLCTMQSISTEVKEAILYNVTVYKAMPLIECDICRNILKGIICSWKETC